MDYEWFIPVIIIGIIVGGFYLGAKLKGIIKINKDNKVLNICFWIILYSLITICIFLKINFSMFLIYMLMFFAVFELLHLFVKITKNNQIKKIYEFIYLNGITVVLISLVFLIFGVYNVNRPVVKEYNIKLEKALKETSNIVMISDLHLGTIRNKNILNDIVKQANKLKPDVFLLIGDIFDENTSEELKEETYTTISKIKTNYGIYFVEGNHDLLTQNTRDGYISNGINILDDKSVLINDNYYLVGRKDYRNNKKGNPRKSLNELLDNIDTKYPIVLLDHQPITNESKDSIVDLQLSGHTHAGQIFPGNLFLKHGYYKKNNLQMIVSSGYGAWSLAVRTAGKSEMVQIHISN